MKVTEILQRYHEQEARKRAELEAENGVITQQRSDILEHEVKPLVIEILHEKCGLEPDELEPAIEFYLDANDWRTNVLDSQTQKYVAGTPYPGGFNVGLKFPDMNTIYPQRWSSWREQDRTLNVKLDPGRGWPFVVDEVGHRDLPSAMEAAAALYQQNKQADADNQKALTEQTEREQLRADQEAAEERRREKLLAQVMMDPVAFRLLQVFSEVMRERAEWHEQLSNANDCIAEMEESLGARLSRAEQAACNTQREAREARDDTREARDDAEAAERKLKQIERER